MQVIQANLIQFLILRWKSPRFAYVILQYVNHDLIGRSHSNGVAS